MQPLAQEYCLLWIQWLCMPRGDWAAWVQALGSLLAVAVALGVVVITLQSERRRRDADEIRRLQLLWALVYRCRVDIASSIALIDEQAGRLKFDLSGEMRHMVQALQRVPTLELMETDVAEAVMTTIDSFIKYEEALNSRRAVDNAYVRQFADTALTNYEFSEGLLRSVLLRRHADIPPKGVISVNGQPYPACWSAPRWGIAHPPNDCLKINGSSAQCSASGGTFGGTSQGW
jgi:hypothetical protein